MADAKKALNFDEDIPDLERTMATKREVVQDEDDSQNVKKLFCKHCSRDLSNWFGFKRGSKKEFRKHGYFCKRAKNPEFASKNGDTYVCKICNQSDTIYDKFVYHMETHSDFFQKKNAAAIKTEIKQEQMEIPENTKSAQCQKCLKMFHPRGLKIHEAKCQKSSADDKEEAESAKVYKCHFCPREYYYPSVLQKHENTCSANSNKKKNVPAENEENDAETNGAENTTEKMKQDDNIFTCNHCSKTFGKRQAHSKHQLACGKKKNIKIEKDDETVEDASKDDKKFTCNTCSKSFQNSKALYLHTRKSDGCGKQPKLTSCTFCDKDFTVGSFKDHSKARTLHLENCRIFHPYANGNACKLCDKIVPPKSRGLFFHLKMKHKEEIRQIDDMINSNETETEFKCRKCNTIFHSKVEACDHVRSHLAEKDDTKPNEKTKTCEFCRKDFIKNENFDLHVTKCKDFFPFIMYQNTCKFCSEIHDAFEDIFKHLESNHGDQMVTMNQKVSYNKSANTHTCEVCNRKFSDKSDVYDHIYTHMDVLFRDKEVQEDKNDDEQADNDDATTSEDTITNCKSTRFCHFPNAEISPKKKNPCTSCSIDFARFTNSPSQKYIQDHKNKCQSYQKFVKNDACKFCGIKFKCKTMCLLRHLEKEHSKDLTAEPETEEKTSVPDGEAMEQSPPRRSPNAMASTPLSTVPNENSKSKRNILSNLVTSPILNEGRKNLKRKPGPKSKRLSTEAQTDKDESPLAKRRRLSTEKSDVRNEDISTAANDILANLELNESRNMAPMAQIHTQNPEDEDHPDDKAEENEIEIIDVPKPDVPMVDLENDETVTEMVQRKTTNIKKEIVKKEIINNDIERPDDPDMISRLWICPICDLGAPTKSKVQDHLNNFHQFSYEKQLKKELAIHTRSIE